MSGRCSGGVFWDSLNDQPFVAGGYTAPTNLINTVLKQVARFI